MRNGSLLSRTAALLLLAGLIWSVLSAIEAPLLASVAADRSRIAEAVALRARAGNANDGIGTLRAQQARLAGYIEALSWKLDRSSPELLSAQLQNTVEHDAAAAGAAVSSSRTTPVQTDGGFKRIGLDFDVQATLPALQALLTRLESSRPAIFVDRLTVQTAENGGSTKGADGQNELSVGLQAAIYAAPRPPSPPL